MDKNKEDTTNINKSYDLTFIKNLKNNELIRYKARPSREKKVDDAVAEKEKIKNDGLRQDIKLKKITWIILFGFLAIETILIFLFSFFQAIHKPWNFTLEEWSFKLLITATIFQVTTMLIIAVNHLFPKNK